MMSKFFFNNKAQHDIEQFIVKKMIICALLLLCLSCAKYSGNKATLRLYNDDIKLQSSLSEIIKKYGPQNHEWRDVANNKIVSYSYIKVVYDIMSFCPIPIAKSKFDNYEVILTFDKKDNLINIKKFIDRTETLPVTVCEHDLADCNLGHKVIERR